jgi:hypothetical protein
MSHRRLDPRSVLIAETDPAWRLYHRPWADKGAWRSLYLRRNVRKGSAPKTTFWLGWNGSRLKRCRDAHILTLYHPDIYSWVQASCALEFSLQSMLSTGA